MSPHLHYQIARAQWHEIEARAICAHHAHELRAAYRPPRRSIKFRIGRVVAAVGACAAISTALAAGGAPANPRPAHHGTNVAAQQFSKEIRALERKGYVQYSCTTNGTEMGSPSTGQVVTVRLRGE